MKRAPVRFNLWAFVPMLAGLLWLGAGSGIGWLFTALPGVLLVAGGTALLLLPGDVRITRMLAVGGLLGALLGPFFWAFDHGALLAALLSLVSFGLAGREGLRVMPVAEDIPPAANDVPMYLRTAVDEALLGYFSATARVPGGDALDRCIETLRAQKQAVESVISETDGTNLLPAPDAPEHVEWHSRRVLGIDFRALHFESGFVADARIPGADRWMAYKGNHQTAAWVLEHEGEDRPWLLGIHGYRMGMPWLDFSLFPPKVLHEKYGLNLLLPVLPLHGPRRAGWRSGDEFLDGDLGELVHAESQALWDLRRHLAWLRGRGATRIGVMGFSLGGYNTALLAQFDNALDFAIAGIPVADLPNVLWPNLTELHRQYFAEQGAGPQLLRDVLAPVSPMARPPLMAKDRRFVFGGLADRLVPPPEVARLAAHWSVEPTWYPGGHVTFRGSGVVMKTLRAAMDAAAWERRH